MPETTMDLNLLIALLSDRELNILKNRARLHGLIDIGRILRAEEISRGNK
jgi:hypothetical protein